MSAASHLTNTIVLGAAGQVGRLLCSSLQSAGIVPVEVDLQPHRYGESYFTFDILQFDDALVNLLRNADCVCICLPEQVALVGCSTVCRLMKQGALWMDTLSVKTPICGLLRNQLNRLSVLSINPMFAPSLGWSGHCVAVAMETADDKAHAMLELIGSWGSLTERVSAEQHDSITAATQVATHVAILSFGETLRRMNYDIDEAMRLSTPPHRVLLSLLYRVVMSNPEVYWSIQNHHPKGNDVRTLSMQALIDVQHSADATSRLGYDAMFQKLRCMLDPAATTLSGWCSGVIDRVLSTHETRSRREVSS